MHSALGRRYCQVPYCTVAELMRPGGEGVLPPHRLLRRDDVPSADVSTVQYSTVRVLVQVLETYEYSYGGEIPRGSFFFEGGGGGGVIQPGRDSRQDWARSRQVRGHQHSSYEAGRLYGTTEVIRQCTEHEAPLNLFYCCFMPIWAPTMVQRVQNSGWGLFHGGCRAKPAISGLGVHGRTNNALA